MNFVSVAVEVGSHGVLAITRRCYGPSTLFVDHLVLICYVRAVPCHDSSVGYHKYSGWLSSNTLASALVP